MSSWRDFLDPDAPAGRYLPWKEVARRTSLSRTTAWRLQRRGEFPCGYPISPGRVGLLEREVDAWMASRAHHSGAVGGRRSGEAPPVPGSARLIEPIEAETPSSARSEPKTRTVSSRHQAEEVPKRPSRVRRETGASRQITFNF